MKIVRTFMLAVSAATVFAGQAAAAAPVPQAKLGLYVLLKAKPGKEQEVADFLRGGKAIVDAEPGTSSWFALRLNQSTFGIFDTFADESGREAHLAGKVAAALMAKAPDLLSTPPSIEKLDVLAAKLPGSK